MAGIPMTQIHDLQQIRALASPMRQAIVDTLEAMGPCTVAELADLLDTPADGLYYHLRILKARRLVADCADLGPSRVQAVADDAPLRVRYEPASRANATAVGRLAGSMLREALRSFRRAFRPGVMVDGPRRALWVGRRTAWLTGEELEEVNARLEGLIGYLAERRGRSGEGRLYSFTFAISPFGGRRKGSRQKAASSA
jgi:DNA-binding transcriptional ArsR family regulator